MEKKWGGFAAAALCVAALGAYRTAAVSASSPGAQGALRYTTRCAVVEINSVDGFVTNMSDDAYAVNGEVRFVFEREGSMSRPGILVFANSMVPSGQTVRVARARLVQPLGPDERCSFDVGSSIRRL